MATTLATLGASVAAVAALWFSGQSLKVTNDQQSLAQQTANTDRFRLAAEQLASDQINVRVSGVYLLERLAKDSPADHPTVFALLTSFLRTHAHNEMCNVYPIDGTRPPPYDPLGAIARKALPVDIDTALIVISRRDVVHDDPVNALDLHRTCLPEAMVYTYAGAAEPNLAGIDLRSAVLVDADLSSADLSSANLFYAFLSGADLGEANLSHANLTGATLDVTTLREADLSYADLTYADLADALIIGADLTGANLNHANLTGVLYDSTTKWPDGFTPPCCPLPVMPPN